MGTYIPNRNKRHPTVVSTLLEAEEDHFLDCPNADLNIRLAAGLLDVILSFLAGSGIQHLCQALTTHLGHLPTGHLAGKLSFLQSLSLFLTMNSSEVMSFTALALKIAFFYFYFVWALAYSGGSPAKLLLGLRVIDSKTGQSLTFPQALLRELVGKGIVFSTLGIGYLTMVTRKDHRALHDLMFQTTVKRIHGGGA